jgi:hypothetical protein
MFCSWTAVLNENDTEPEEEVKEAIYGDVGLVVVPRKEEVVAGVGELREGSHCLLREHDEVKVVETALVLATSAPN